jgi:hypothetical protein
MNSYIANMPRKGLSAFLEEDERKKEEERFIDEVNFSTETRVNTDKGYKEEFDRDQTFLQKTGDFVKQVLSIPDRLDKAVGIYDTRQSAIKTITGGLSEDHLIAALAGEMLVPDTIDLITLGLGYIPRRVLLKGPKAIKMFLKFKKSKLPKAAFKSQAMPNLGDAGKLADEADYDAMTKAVIKEAERTGQNVDEALAEAGARQFVKKDKDGFIENNVSPKGDTRGIGNNVQPSKTAREVAQDKYNTSGDLFGNLPLETKNQLNRLGLTDEEQVLLLQKYEMTDIGRKGAAAIESLFDTTMDFEDVKRAALPAFIEAAADLVNRTGSKTFEKPQLDHVAQLMASLGFFQGRKVKEFPYVAKILAEEGVYLGNRKSNLEFLHFDVHTVKTNFWRDLVGGAGEKFFFNADGTRKIFDTEAKLRKAARDYRRIIDQSDKLVANANTQFKLMNPGDEIPEEVLYELMSRVQLTDLSKKYNIKQVRKIMDEILADTKTLAGFSNEMRKSFGKQYNKALNQLTRFIRKEDRARTILLDVVQNNLTYNQATHKYLHMGITQLEFEGMKNLVKQKGVRSKLKNLGTRIRRRGTQSSATEISKATDNKIGSSFDVDI